MRESLIRLQEEKIKLAESLSNRTLSLKVNKSKNSFIQGIIKEIELRQNTNLIELNNLKLVNIYKSKMKKLDHKYSSESNVLSKNFAGRSELPYGLNDSSKAKIRESLLIEIDWYKNIIKGKEENILELYNVLILRLNDMRTNWNIIILLAAIMTTLGEFTNIIKFFQIILYTQ